MLSQIFLGVDTGHASTLFIYYADDDVFNQSFFAIFGCFSLTHRSLRCWSGGAP